MDLLNKIRIIINCGKYKTKQRKWAWYWSTLIQPILDESVAGKLWWQECEAVGPVASTTRRQTQGI